MIMPELSFEEAWYDLGQEWLPDDLKALICKTIVLLPEVVREFALRNLTFVAFDHLTYGQTMEASIFSHLTRRGRTSRNHWAVILNPRIVKRSDGMFTVAHEIAHAWLKHPTLCANLLAEEQADDLVYGWGFEVPRSRPKIHAEARAMVEEIEASATA